MIPTRESRPERDAIAPVRRKLGLIRELAMLAGRHHPQSSGRHEELLPGAGSTLAERELAVVVESSDDAIIGKTLDGTITSWNPAAERMYGYAANEVIGRSISILVPPGRFDELARNLDQLRAGDRIEHLETVRLRKDGTEIHVSINLSPVDRDGSIVGASALAHDTSNRRRSERRAGETLALLEAIQATAPVGFAFVDRDFRVARVNETLAELVGKRVDQLLGLPIATAIDEIHDEVEGILADVLETGAPVTGREFVYSGAAPRDQARRWLTSFYPVSVDGEIGGIGIVAFDITERKQMEEALRTAKEHAERLIETSNAIVLVLDDGGNVLVLNKAGEEITGYRREELVGRNWDIVVPRDRYPDAWRAFDALIENGLEQCEHPILTKSGEERVVLWRNAQVIEHGRVTGTVSFGIDVTESVRARQEAIQSHELLRVADRQRRALLSRLVHAQEDERLRIAGEIHDDPLQALSVLAMNLDLLARRVDDPALLSDLSEGRESVRAAIASLRHMIFTLHPPVLDQEGLGRAIGDQLEKLRQETGIAVRLEEELSDPPEEETALMAFKIVQEALMNVRKHAGANHVDVSLTESAEGLVVRITDDGRGFEIRPNEPGHLGLILMRERAEMAGGWLRIESEPGHGTTVECVLPASMPRTGQRARHA